MTSAELSPADRGITHSGLAAVQDAYDGYLPAWQLKEIGNVSTCGS